MRISFLPEHLFNIDGLSVTNSLLVSWIAVIFLAFAAWRVSRQLKLKPKARSLQNLAEAAIEAFFNLIQGITENRELTSKMFPLVATIFCFILFSNWLELIPGVGTIGLVEITPDGTSIVPLFRSPSSDLNVTIALAVSSVLATQLFGITALGFFKYGKKFLNFSSPAMLFVGILELISEVTRMVSFSFRLFGNLFAGEVLLTVIMFLVPLFIPLPFFFLELVVGFIQAFIFSMLTVVFIKMATASAEH